MRFQPHQETKPSESEWFGDLPNHWNLTRVKNLAEYWVSNVDKVASEEEIPIKLCNYTDVYKNERIRPSMPLMETTATLEEIHRFGLKEGDVLITKDSEDWRDIAVPALVAETSPDLVCGYHLAIVRARKSVLRGDYVLRLFQATSVNKQLQVSASGVTRYGLPKAAIGGALIPAPPQHEQESIASFLDKETERIDLLVKDKRDLIERLRERRSVLISRTVTRGLPAEAARAAGLRENPPLKPSGFDWIGEIPSHWGLKKFGYIAVVVRGASPRPAGDDRYFNGDFIPWITVGEVTKDGEMHLTRTETMLTEEGSECSRIIPKGTLVITNSGATLGVPKILSIKGCANDGIVAFLELKRDVSKEFLYYYLTSLTNNLRDRIKQGSGQPNLNTEIIKALPVPLPDEDEQKAIVAFLKFEVARLDKLSSTVELAIERLQEYRAALINAAVTGKIDVRKAIA